MICDPIMLSALEHYVYCPRQCALIHIEQVWDENLYTTRGQIVHRNVDEPSLHLREGVEYERAMPLWSEELHLVGKADLVEFDGQTPYPVEYKSGRKRRGDSEKIQLCAQALCLEEMLRVEVPRGALFWHASRERMEVVFTDALRQRTKEIALAAWRLINSGEVPPAVLDKRCDNCSMRHSCLPEATADQGKIKRAYQELYRVNE